MFRTVDLHLALVGLFDTFERAGASAPRERLAWVRREAQDTGSVCGVRLDATASGFRPRELGRSARRDLAASLRRDELAFGGLDALVPAAHFTRSETQERALDAVVQACELCADLGALADGRGTTVCVELSERCPVHVRAAITAAGERWGIGIANLTSDAVEALQSGQTGVGVDPAAWLMAGEEPQAGVSQAGANLRAARLSDCNTLGRCAVGADGARLDVTAYAASVSLSTLDTVSIDLRGVADASRGIQAAARAWSAALTLPGQEMT